MLNNKKKIKCHVKRGDKVKVITGNDKNKIGEVIKVFPKQARLLVMGINFKYKYIKNVKGSTDNKKQEGRIIQKEFPIHISNVMFTDPETKQPTKIGRKMNEQNKLQRYAKKTGKFI